MKQLATNVRERVNLPLGQTYPQVRSGSVWDPMGSVRDPFGARTKQLRTKIFGAKNLKFQKVCAAFAAVAGAL